MGVDHASGENARQLGLVRRASGVRQVRASDQSLQQGLARPVAAAAEGAQGFRPARAVQQQLAQRPEGGFAATLDGIVEMRDQRRRGAMHEGPAEAQQAVEPDRRIRAGRSGQELLRVARISGGLQRAKPTQRLDRGIARSAFRRKRCGRFGRGMQAAERPDRVRRRHEARRRGGVPEAVGILVAQEPPHPLLDNRIAGISASGFQGDQGHRSRRRIAVVFGPDPCAVGARTSRLESPAAILALQGEQPREVRRGPLPQRLVQTLGFGDPPRGVRQLPNLLDVVRRPDPMEEFDPMAVIIGDPDLVGCRQDLAALFLEREEIPGLPGIAPGAFQDLGSELEDDVGPEVRSPPGRVDALGIGSLEHVVRRAALPLGVEFLGPEGPLVQHDVPPSDPRSGGTIAEIVRRDAGVDGGVLELVRQAQRFVHGVDEAPIVLLHAERAIAVAQGIGHAPDSALGVAAHAVLAEQRGRVPRPPVRRDVARPVDQPRIDLGQVVIDPLPDRLHGIVVRPRPEEPHLQFVVRLVRLDPQVVGLARLEFARDERAERAVLLVRPLVDRAALLIGVDGHRSGNDRGGRVNVRDRIEVREVVAVRHVPLAAFRGTGLALLVEADASARNRLHDLEIRAQEARFGAVVLDAVPVVRRPAYAGVVEVLEIVRSADDIERLIPGTVLKLQVRRLFRRVVRLGLQEQVAARESFDRTHFDRDGNGCNWGRRGRQRGGERSAPGVMGNLAQRLGPLLHGAEPQRVRSRARRPIDQIDIRIQGMEHLGPIGRGLDAAFASVSVEGEPGQLRPVPRDLDPGIGRQGGRPLNPDAQLESVALGQVPGAGPVAVERKLCGELGRRRGPQSGKQERRREAPPRSARACVRAFPVGLVDLHALAKRIVPFRVQCNAHGCRPAGSGSLVAG